MICDQKTGTQKNPSAELYRQVADFIGRTTGLSVTIEQATEILSNQPAFRDCLVESQGTGDTYVRDWLSDIVAQYFLESEWPTFGDQIDTKGFLVALHEKAIAKGFSLTVC